MTDAPPVRDGGWFGIRMIAAAALTGAAAGVGGVLLTLLLHLVQHLAFGYTEETFLTGVERASPARRVLAMTVGGAVVGLGWWALRRFARPTATTGDALTDPRQRLRVAPTAADAALQIVAVGFGASLGREGAPRQVGAALGAAVAERFGLDAHRRRTILACGAGAGLAAVYNVPLGGALFTLEVLLASAAVRHAVPAVLSAGVATAVAWPVLFNRPTYQVVQLGFHASVLVCAVLLGPIAGLAGWAFLWLTGRARSLAPRGWRMSVAILAVFATVGALAIEYPQLLGNGKGPAQLAFDGTLPATALVALIVLKPVVTAACLASGAAGGLLTPALATGAMLGALSGGLWSMIWPGAPIAAFALVGGAAVLAVTQKAPLCSIVLVLELTHTGLALLVPMLICVAGAMLTARWVARIPSAGRGL